MPSSSTIPTEAGAVVSSTNVGASCWRTIALCNGFCFIDALISTISLGLYHDNVEQPMFDPSRAQIWQYLTFKGGYSFSTSPFDFFALMLLRSLLLLVILLPLRYSNSTVRCLLIPSSASSPTTFYSKILNFSMLGLLICSFSYSLIKLLAFSDLERQLHFPGVWLSISWNLIAFLCLQAIYQLWLFRPNNEYQRRIEATNGSTTPYQPLFDESTSAEDITPESSEPIRNNSQQNGGNQLRISTWSHIRCLLNYCWHYRGWLAVGFVFLVIYSVARIFVPLYMAKVISNFVSTRDVHKFFQSLTYMSILLAVVILFGGLRAGTLNYTTAQIERLIRQDLFNSVTSQEIAFFDQAQTGEILSRLIADCETMSATISTNVNILLRNGLMVLGSVIFMLSMSWRLTTVTLIVIPPIAFFTKLYSVYYDHLSTRTQDCKANANRIAEEVVSSMRNVRAFASEHKEQARFEEQLEQTLKVQKKKSLALAGFQWVNELANNCILVAIIGYGGYLVLSDRMSTDQMFAFLLYQLQLGENFYMLNSVATGLMECVGASRKVFEYLQRTPRIQLDAGKHRPEQVLGKVEFRKVSFAYPTRPNTLVLKDLSFIVRPGELVALVGPSGAGKSSVISLLEHFYEPLRGEILLDDVPIEQYEHRFFHQKVSLVSQEPTLYACSIRENILYGCDDGEHDMASVVEAAKLANIHHFVVASENNYDTKCGEKGVQMSGGQKQRIAIARALIRRPAVLILDEATSALDAESEHIIQQALLQCAEGRTVVLIAHRLSTVERADRIFVLDGGQIVQMGNHAELMAEHGGIYRSLVKRQLLGVATKGAKTTTSAEGRATGGSDGFSPIQAAADNEERKSNL